MTLARQFEAYRSWRDDVARQADRLEAWLAEAELLDREAERRLARIRTRLAEDRLVVAFVAEFSRGKSELINALFFSDRGGRVLPSSAGRTTMCPTEISWKRGTEPGIALLPIETRAEGASIAELRGVPEAWINFPFAADSTVEMVSALRRVGDVKRLPADAARALGFAVGDGTDGSLVADAGGQVDVPRWRHAMINFPHPLLEQGLIVLDTPGLNAIGAEPELTLSLLPNAHAVLFILAADTGVTQTDLTVWRDHVGSGPGRLAVLNKIDGLWDGLRSTQEIDAEIERQTRSCASMLGLTTASVFPVSAQKGLVAKINGDEALLRRSRLPALEDALAEDLLPAKREIVARGTVTEALNLAAQARQLLVTRHAAESAQLAELNELRGKNQSVVSQTLAKARLDKDTYERSLREYHAVRSVFSQLSERLYSHLGMSTLRVHARRARDAMRDANFTSQLVAAMSDLFESARASLAESERGIGEITEMIQAMHEKFGLAYGARLEPPPAFTLANRQRQVYDLENRSQTQFGGFLNLVTREKHALTQQFSEVITSQLRRIFDHANRDTEVWLRSLLTPLENHVREVQRQLKHRIDSVRRIHEAAGNLEERIEELGQGRRVLDERLNQLALLTADLRNAIDARAGQGQA